MKLFRALYDAGAKALFLDDRIDGDNLFVSGFMDIFACEPFATNQAFCGLSPLAPGVSRCMDATDAHAELGGQVANAYFASLLRQ